MKSQKDFEEMVRSVNSEEEFNSLEISSVFASELINARLEKNLTQAELADKLSLGESTISFYEGGKREPDYNTLQRFADFFGVSVDYILGRTDIRIQPRESSDDEDFTKEELQQIEVFKKFLKSRRNFPDEQAAAGGK